MSDNTFSIKSNNYAQSRPRYPDSLLDWIAGCCQRTDNVWDCATGNGQAAVDLASRFSNVFATDVSQEQISNHLYAPNVSFSVQSAENTSFDSNTFDLVTVAQALHWFDYSRFWPEVRRVSRKNAFFCAWGYDWLFTGTPLDENVVAPFRSAIQPFWAVNNRILWDGYSNMDISFPFERVSTPSFEIHMQWTILQIVEYMKTWSAYKNSLSDPIASSYLVDIAEHVRNFECPDFSFDVRMPLKIVAGNIV
ncbi:class I SAM-dependent methyltransferase [Pseudomonas sp. LRF_L74]|uniref:class I SAM-dependent methyltransferase n=1 Tax=Pseudomonas sp. LRF_L74 TaxID=3369422 RepID=UPI003F600B9C